MEVRRTKLSAAIGLSLVLLLGMGMAYGGSCIQATGEITCIPAGDLIDGETVTISDPSTSATFEFELSSNGVGVANTPVYLDASDTASDVASTLASSINMLGTLSVMALASGDKVLLTQSTPGPSGNIPILETVANSSFVVRGFSGGICPEIPTVPVFPIEPALVAATASALAIGLIRRRGQ